MSSVEYKYKQNVPINAEPPFETNRARTRLLFTLSFSPQINRCRHAGQNHESNWSLSTSSRSRVYEFFMHLKLYRRIVFAQLLWSFGRFEWIFEDERPIMNKIWFHLIHCLRHQKAYQEDWGYSIDVYGVLLILNIIYISNSMKSRTRQTKIIEKAIT